MVVIPEDIDEYPDRPKRRDESGDAASRQPTRQQLVVQSPRRGGKSNDAQQNVESIDPKDLLIESRVPWIR
jgi:hypothetical protein